MKKILQYKLLFFPIIAALTLSIITLLFLNRSLDLTSASHRNNLLLVLSENIEKRLKTNPKRNPLRPRRPLPERDRRDRPPRPLYKEAPPPPPEERGNGRRFRLLMWIVDSKGNILFSNHPGPLSLNFKDINLPHNSNKVLETSNFFRTSQIISAIKLNITNKELYLLAKDEINAHNKKLFNSNAIILFLIVALAFSLSIIFIFFYLRRKADEAKTVLKRMASKDLKARFSIKRFDEFSGLMLSFNEMAEEIDRLVSRLREVESSRRLLLQELGHDLRTPLTSMRGATDTLIEIGKQLSEKQRFELYEVLRHDTKYLAHLLDQLIFLSSIDDPKYNSKNENISLTDLLKSEMIKRNVNSQIKWTLIKENDLKIFADKLLLKRLFTNILDNAARFAKEEIKILIRSYKGKINIEITDDGPGFSAEALQNFGKRKGFISRSSEDEKIQSHFGSLIIKKIVTLYDGEVEIKNNHKDKEIKGAKVSIFFKAP